MCSHPPCHVPAALQPAQQLDATVARLPHILFILADDLGFADVGFNHPVKSYALTPQLDALASEGVILDRHYTHCVCSPSRAAIQSGRPPAHVHARNNPSALGMPAEMTGLGEVMSKANYMAAFVGKWDDRLTPTLTLTLTLALTLTLTSLSSSATLLFCKLVHALVEQDGDGVLVANPNPR